MYAFHHGLTFGVTGNFHWPKYTCNYTIACCIFGKSVYAWPLEICRELIWNFSFRDGIFILLVNGQYWFVFCEMLFSSCIKNVDLHGITYSFPNFNGCTIEVWEWISNYILNFTGHMISYPWWCKETRQQQPWHWSSSSGILWPQSRLLKITFQGSTYPIAHLPGASKTAGQASGWWDMRISIKRGCVYNHFFILCPHKLMQNFTQKITMSSPNISMLYNQTTVYSGLEIHQMFLIGLIDFSIWQPQPKIL